MKSAEQNRAFWDSYSDEYQRRHHEFIGRPEPRWGVWQIPDDELGIIGDVAGKDVLELGCGAAQWSILLARQGARAVGIDNSPRQLEHAARAVQEAGVDVRLVQGDAEELPFEDESFDVAFCDHGALSFADPCLVVPEAARVLRPGGLLAFSHMSPFALACQNPDTDVVEPVLHRDYFALRRIDNGPGDSVEFNLPYGEWIRLLRASGLALEDLVEPRPAADAVSTYWDESERDWARRWPSEAIWKARKHG